MLIRPPLARFLLLGFVLLGILGGGCRQRSQPESAPSPSAGTQTAGPATIRTKSGLEMVRIPGGEFVMGDDHGEDDEQPAHAVQIGPFYMDVCEVTQESFQTMMGRNPSKWVDQTRPVDRMSWYAALQYCNMRSTREDFKPCYDLETLRCDFAADGYRLPTEAEWEYACRAATTTRYSFGDDAGALDDYAWFKQNSDGTTHPVKQKKPNPWGLYDMHGNVAEWCYDFYAEGYEAGQAQDPSGPESGEDRVLRGGSWKTSEESCRSSARDCEAPGLADVCFGFEAYGFRCVRNAGDPSSALTGTVPDDSPGAADPSGEQFSE